MSMDLPKSGEVPRLKPPPLLCRLLDIHWSPATVPAALATPVPTTLGRCATVPPWPPGPQAPVLGSLMPSPAAGMAMAPVAAPLAPASGL